jgi:hypothetical protein
MLKKARTALRPRDHSFFAFSPAVACFCAFSPDGIRKLAPGPEAPLRRATGKNNAITARSGMRETEAPLRFKSNLYLLKSAGPGVGSI